MEQKKQWQGTFTLVIWQHDQYAPFLEYLQFHNLMSMSEYVPMSLIQFDAFFSSKLWILSPRPGEPLLAQLSWCLGHAEDH